MSRLGSSFLLGAWTLVFASTIPGCTERTLIPSGSDLQVDTVVAVDGPEIPWDTQPLFLLGGSAEGDHPLHLTREARIRSDSGLVILQQSVQSLLVFNRDGVLIERVGGAGDGPGEFRRVRNLALLAGDSILAWDAGLRRLSTFDGSGELSEVVSFRQGATPLDFYLVGTETIVTISTPRENRGLFGRSGLYRQEQAAEFLDRSGEAIGRIEGVPGIEIYRGEHTLAVPYSYRLHVTGGDDGLFVGEGRGSQLIEFSIGGEARRILQLPIERKPVSREQLSTRMQEYVHRSYPPERQDSALRTLQAAATAADIDSLPAFIDLLSDRDGHLWLEMSRRESDEPGLWLVVDPLANEARWVRGLPGWTVLDAGHGLVAAMREDSLGVEHLGVFLVRP